VCAGLGSSLKYGWARTWAAVGREVGFRAKREERRAVPWVVSRGNLERRIEPLLVGLGFGGRRRVRALGRRVKEGQVVLVGRPRREKICCGV